ncbi:MAG: hypothetical protein WC700_17070 [Gemmatimonadaceae bacterium]|jgi:hypothetical protein
MNDLQEIDPISITPAVSRTVSYSHMREIWIRALASGESMPLFTGEACGRDDRFMWRYNHLTHMRWLNGNGRVDAILTPVMTREEYATRRQRTLMVQEVSGP